jgi:hypothetical protein
MGKKATLINVGGEGAPRYQFVEEKGTHEDDADIDQKRTSKFISVPGEKGVPPMGMDDLSLGHMGNWFDCIRSRQEPHASVHAGFAHSVACMMSAEAYWSGRKIFWDAKTETFSDTRPS